MNERSVFCFPHVMTLQLELRKEKKKMKFWKKNC